MPRRRRPQTDRQLEQLLSGLGGLVLLAVFFVPGARAAILSLGLLVVLAAILITLGAVIFFIYKVAAARRRATENVFVKTFDLLKGSHQLVPSGANPLVSLGPIASGLCES